MYQLQVLQKAREDMQKSADWYNEQTNRRRGTIFIGSDSYL
jgi:hypothetical protein